MKLVVGLGNIGSRLVKESRFIGIHHTDPIPDDVSAIVNCAGLAGAGVCKASPWADVVDANVAFALGLEAECHYRKIPYFALSTAGVYARQVSVARDIKCSEQDAVYPHNKSIASKILMEVALSDSYILRLPVLSDPVFWKEKAANWKVVTATYTSLFSIDLLARVVCAFVEKKPSHGIYNVGEGEPVYFPNFIHRTTGWIGDSTSLIEKDTTSCVVLDSRKVYEILSG